MAVIPTSASRLAAPPAALPPGHWHLPSRVPHCRKKCDHLAFGIARRQANALPVPLNMAKLTTASSTIFHASGLECSVVPNVTASSRAPGFTTSSAGRAPLDSPSTAEAVARRSPLLLAVRLRLARAASWSSSRRAPPINAAIAEAGPPGKRSVSSVATDVADVGCCSAGCRTCSNTKGQFGKDAITLALSSARSPLNAAKLTEN